MSYQFKTNTISSWDKYKSSPDKYNIILLKTNAVSSMYKYSIEIFSDPICAVHLDTQHQFVGSIFGKPLVIRILDNFY